MQIDRLSKTAIKDIILALGEKSFRADQVYDWVYKHGVSSYDEMTNIPLELKNHLSTISPLTILKEVSRVSSADGTTKFLFELEDGLKVESVLLKDGERISGCISSQVGCKMGCKFCATFMALGYKRDLTSAEIVKQVVYLRQAAYELFDERLSNLVFMGMGEPLDNIDNLIKALEIILDDDLLAFSHRKVTVSTSGLTANIDKLFQMKTPVNLAVSINAPNEEIRKELMPVTIKYPLKELIAKLKTLELDKHKRITFEYVLLGGVNDSLDDAKQFIKLIKGVKAKVNLIIYNGSKFTSYKEPKMERVLKFQDFLIENNVPAFIRKRLGEDIKGACGQLAAE